MQRGTRVFCLRGRLLSAGNIHSTGQQDNHTPSFVHHYSAHKYD